MIGVTKATTCTMAGRFLEPDGWKLGQLLRDCTDWDKADYRINGGLYSLAVNVKVTGRKIKRRCDGDWIRVSIVFVGDSSPDIKHGGWLAIKTETEAIEALERQVTR